MLNDFQKQKIIADYVNAGSISESARMNGVSRTTVRRIVRNDTDLSGKLQRKKEQDTQDILDYMNARRSKAKEIIESLLDELADEEKLRAANIVQIATVMGILIDKFVYLPEKIKNEKNRQEIMLLRVERTLPADSDCMENDTLISALKSAAGEVWPQEGEGIEES